MILVSGYDRRVDKTEYRVRYWTEAEVLSIDGNRDPLHFIANDGTMRDIRLNGAVKRWKARVRDGVAMPSRVEIPVKYGLRECARWSAEEACRRLVKILAEKSPDHEGWIQIQK